MKLLLITGALYPNTSATTEISYRIANHLSNSHACEIYMLGYSTNSPYENEYPNIQTIHIRTIEQFIEFERSFYNQLKKKNIKNKLKKMIFFFTHPFSGIKFLHYWIHKRNDYVVEYCKATKKILSDIHFDAVITFFHPKAPIKALLKIRPNIPSVFYKVDLWSTDIDANLHFSQNKERKMERRADDYSDAIIITKSMFDEYISGAIDGYEINKNKLHVLQFPIVREYKKSREKNNLFDKRNINCVFAGSIHPNIRNPLFTINLFKELQKYGIVLHIFGNNDVPYNIEVPSNVVYHGRVSFEESISIMQEADVLVNIGNTTKNQFPSKILSYISVGKPILNIIKSDECPTIELMDRYPIKCNIFEKNGFSDKVVDVVRSFIVRYRSVEVPFQMIQDLYYDCTQRYVGERVFDIISSVLRHT